MARARLIGAQKHGDNTSPIPKHVRACGGTTLLGAGNTRHSQKWREHDFRRRQRTGLWREGDAHVAGLRFVEFRQIQRRGFETTPSCPSELRSVALPKLHRLRAFRKLKLSTGLLHEPNTVTGEHGAVTVLERDYGEEEHNLAQNCALRCSGSLSPRTRQTPLDRRVCHADGFVCHVDGMLTIVHFQFSTQTAD